MLPEATRLSNIDNVVNRKDSSTSRQSYAERYVKRYKVDKTDDSSIEVIGERRLARFLAAAEIYGQRPGVDAIFRPADHVFKLLVASHLRLIVGKEAYDKHRFSLYPMIDSEMKDLSIFQNLILTTGRQQGKTTLITKMLALLCHLAVDDGELACIYCTSTHKTSQLLGGVKEFLIWAADPNGGAPALAAIGVRPPSFLKDTVKDILVISADGYRHAVHARPKTVKANRGEAPRSIWVDEAAFVESDIIDRHVQALLAVEGRVATLITTPAKRGTSFDIWVKNIERENSHGKYFYYLVNHSLVCNACYDSADAGTCCHRMWYMPEWTSILRLKRLASTSSDPAAYEAEMLGAIDRGHNAIFPDKLVGQHIIPSRIMEHLRFDDDVIFFVAVDPGSHQSSKFGVTCFVYTTKRKMVVFGHGEFKIGAAQIDNMCVVISDITRRSYIAFHRLRQCKPRFVPIVECVNNEFQGQAIVAAIKTVAAEFKCEWVLPYDRRETPNVIDNLGVWTTEANKQAGITNLNRLMGDSKIVFSSTMATPLSTTNGLPIPPVNVLATLARSLCAFQMDTRGKISGKTSLTDDDGAMSLILGGFWSRVAMRVMET